MSFSIENISEWPQVERLATDFPQLTIELFVESVEKVLRPLYEENLKDDYAKSLKSAPPSFIDIDNFIYDASCKTDRNKRVVERVQKYIAEKNMDRVAFERLFYLVRLDGKPVGTLEIYKDGSDAVQYGVFTDFFALETRNWNGRFECSHKNVERKNQNYQGSL